MKYIKITILAAMLTTALLSFRMKTGHAPVDFGTPIALLGLTALAAHWAVREPKITDWQAAHRHMRRR